MRFELERDTPASRPAYLALAVVTVMMGLASRSTVWALPEAVTLYVGDALWAMWVFWLVRALNPALRASHSAVIALGVAFAVELSQLYHAPWIDGVRSTTLGGLVLGFGFRTSDLVCYVIGVGLGGTLDRMVLAKANTETP